VSDPIPFLYFAWTLVQPIEGTRRGYIVCTTVVVGAVNVWGVAKSTCIGAIVCSAELIASKWQSDLRADLRHQRGKNP
jgi:hypothetical protein